MVTIEKIDTENKGQVRRFVELPHRIYKDCAQWVPPLNTDAYGQLDRKKHPFHEHSDMDFFLAVREGRDVGRIAAIENKPFNSYHQTRESDFYFFECENDPEAAAALFNTVFDWSRARGLNSIIGPKGMGPLDGYGIADPGVRVPADDDDAELQPRVLSGAGGGRRDFVKEVDFVSCYLPADNFKIPDRVVRIAKRAMERGHLQTKEFKSKRELIEWAGRIGEAYNKAFVHNWEYYPLSDREIKFVVDNIMTVADHRLIKVVTHGEDVVGFLFAFHDLSAALQRARGRLNPLTLADLLLEMRRTHTVTVNGMGILPEFQGHGGNAILYYEMGRTLLNFTNQFQHVEMTQVAETTEQMRADLKNLNGVEYKNNRVYRRGL